MPDNDRNRFHIFRVDSAPDAEDAIAHMGTVDVGGNWPSDRDALSAYLQANPSAARIGLQYMVVSAVHTETFTLSFQLERDNG